MESPTLDTFTLLAAAFAYPAPGRLERLDRGMAAFSDGPGKEAYRAFVQRLHGLSLGAWEELHTRTLDLDPPAAPYVGYQTWGESYARGTFLSTMSRALAEAGVPAGGELPDHLEPILRYLGRSKQPLPELVSVLGPALDRMLATLRRADPGNPYIDLLEAVRSECRGLVEGLKEDA